MQSRRQFTQVLLAGIPLARAYAAINSKFDGVQIGAQSYSFRDLPADQILPAFVKCGLGEAELMSNHAETLVGAPSGRGPEAAEALRKWRSSVSLDKFKDVRKQFDAAGVTIELLCYNLSTTATDDEIDYSFQMAKALSAKAISSSTKVSVAKRVAPFADKHKMMWGAHGHDNTTDPDEFSTPESFAAAMSYGKYMGVNLDVGHFFAANYDPVAYIKEHHARITNLHLKDRKKDHGPNVPWGQGDTPIKEVLLLLKKEKYPLPANIEYEYKGTDGTVIEVSKCVEFCKKALS